MNIAHENILPDVDIPVFDLPSNRKIRGYHGTTIPNITHFNPADESTIGDGGIYFTLDKNLAIGYGLLRKEERASYEKVDQSGYLYEVELSNARILNLSEDANIDSILEVFKFYLEGYLQEAGSLSQKFGLEKIRIGLWEKVIRRAIEQIDNGEINSGTIKLIGFGILGKIFTEIVTKKLGFDGVACWEGGDDKRYTNTPGISVAIYNSGKIGNIIQSDI